MRCSSCEVLLDRYVEGTLTPKQMRHVGEHLKTCASCSSLVTELRVVDALLATTPAPDLAPNFTFAVMAEVRSAQVPQQRTHSIWAVLTFYLIAAWLACGAGFMVFGERIAGVASVTGSLRTGLAHSIGAVSGTAHALGPATPAVVGFVTGILALDVMLIAAIVLFHRTIRPRLSARLAHSEAS